MTKRKISLSSSATQFDKALFNHDSHVALFLAQPPVVGTALALIPGEGVVDLTPARKKADKQMMLNCPVGTKETSLYVITPEMGGKPRWFEKRLLSAWLVTAESATVTLSERGVKERKLQAYAI